MSIKVILIANWNNISTSSGIWSGYAKGLNYAAHGDVDIYTGCILIYFEKEKISTIVAATTVIEIGVENPTRYTISEIMQVGLRQIGTISSIGPFSLTNNGE